MASTDDGLSAAQRRLATTLEDRNRQISDLADLIRVAPISKDATAVAHAMVAGARQVTGDPTWLLAVLRVPETRDLEAGVYGPNAGIPAGHPGRGASLGGHGRGARHRLRATRGSSVVPGAPSPSSTSPRATSCEPSCSPRGRVAPTRPRPS